MRRLENAIVASRRRPDSAQGSYHQNTKPECLSTTKPVMAAHTGNVENACDTWHTKAHFADSWTAPLRRRKRRRLSLVGLLSGNSFASFTSTFALAVTLLCFQLVTPAQAVRVKFQNCLPDSYRFNDPTPLQFDPLFADARFDTEDEKHTLQVTVWSNVTGSYNEGGLPPADDPYWHDDEQTDGKIIQTPEPDTTNPRATTLIRKVNVLTYTPWSDADDFCKMGLDNATCPLSPVFESVTSVDPYALPSVNITHDFFSSYAFSSFSATFIVIYGDTAATNIGCASATITPDLGTIAWILKFLPLLVLLLTGFAVVLASIFSPWGTTDIFLWTSNNGRDADLLRLVTPGFGDCLQYIQFIALTGGLTLDYPGFYQPIVSQVGWSALMFNESFVTNSQSWQSVVDGIYVTNGTHGLEELGQLVGMAEPVDIWAGMMVWLCVIIAAVFVLTQIGFVAQFLYRKIMGTSEEDLRAKNIPFSVGNVIRITFNYFLLPIVALSAFQLVIAADSPAYTVALAALTLAVLVGFTSWLLYLIISTRPKSVLFDDLSTVLKFGPLYNTYSDEVAAFALIPVLLTFTRGIAIGAVQPSGIAQVVLLAICEVIHMLMLHAFRPFHSPTSMNAYHTLFSALRLITIMLMVAFSPTLGVIEGPKGWIGYVILLIHGAVLIFGFFLGALQTIIEVVARMMGAGGDDVRGLTRGGLSKIFGMRQLSRRVTHRAGPSRASQLSTSAMLHGEDAGKAGYDMPSGRIRSESAASLGGFGGMTHGARNRTSSAMDSIDVYSGMPRSNMDNASSYMPGTPGQASTFSSLASPMAVRRASSNMAMEAPDPYYRPPRRRRDTLNDPLANDQANRESVATDPRPLSQTLDNIDGPEDLEDDTISRGPTPIPRGGSPVSLPPNRPDYATREVDFYYGVRGPALNSDGPGRKLGTGPADPTGPVATATGWMRNMLGGKSKDKSKGFEVVRSARMPPGMKARHRDFGDESPPEGIPVAMGVLRNGPIDSDDDDDDVPKVKQARNRSGDLLSDDAPRSGHERVESPVSDQAPQIGELIGIPRSTSRRQSGFMDESNTPSLNPRPSTEHDTNESAGATTLAPTARLPFQHTGSTRRLSSTSSMDLNADPSRNASVREDRPASFGVVPQHEVSRSQPSADINLNGSTAELVDDQGVVREGRK